MPGWKVVAGKKGNRKWVDDIIVEDELKKMRLSKDEMYKMKLISPTDAEKMFKKDNPKRWSKLQDFITQSEGPPAIVEESDKRPALEIKEVEFDNLDDSAAE